MFFNVAESITEEERSARYASTSHSEVTWLFEIMFLILLTWSNFCICNWQSKLYFAYECYIRFAPIPNTEFVLGCCSVLLLHLEVPEVVIIGVLGVIHQNMIGVKVGWSQGDTVMAGIIETVQNHHLVMDYRDYDNKSRYESSRRTPGMAQV